MSLNPSLFPIIFDRIAEGESLRSVALAMGFSRTAFFNAIDADKTLEDQYTRARARCMDSHADLIADISDEVPPGDEFGRTDTGYVAHQKLRIDTRKWLMSKLAPKKYGDKIGVEMDISDNYAAKLAAARVKVQTPDE